MAKDTAYITEAKKVAESIGVKVVYKNSKGEYFTVKNNADNSDTPENIETFDFSESETEAPANAAAPVAPKVNPKPKKVKYTLTADDIAKQTAFTEAGLKEGDVISFDPVTIAPDQLLLLLGQKK